MAAGTLLDLGNRDPDPAGMRRVTNRAGSVSARLKSRRLGMRSHRKLVADAQSSVRTLVRHAGMGRRACVCESISQIPKYCSGRPEYARGGAARRPH